MCFKRCLIIFCCILAIVTIFSSISTTIVFADDESLGLPTQKEDPDDPANASSFRCPMCKKTHFLGDLKGWKFLYNWKNFLYGSKNLFTQLAGNGILGFDITTTTAWTSIEGLYENLISVIGNILVVLYFFGELYDLFADDKFTPETFFRAFIKLVVSFLVIENSFKLVGLAINFAIGIYAELENGVRNIDAANACNFEYLYQAGFFGKIGELFLLLIVYAVTAIVFLILQFYCVLRLLDIVIKAFFAPIAMADIGFKGTHSSGWRYLKKIMATSLQGAIMLATIYIQSLITMQENFTGNIFITIATSFAMVAVFKKAQTMANDIVGA